MSDAEPILPENPIFLKYRYWTDRFLRYFVLQDDFPDKLEFYLSVIQCKERRVHF
jgi:hypothetical protein